jgi:hypothetical protein
VLEDKAEKFPARLDKRRFDPGWLVALAAEFSAPLRHLHPSPC